MLGKTLHALSKTSPKYSKCQHCQVLHTVLYSGVVQEVNTSGYTCFLLKVLLQAGSHHTRAHPTHKCSYHSTECRLWMVKSAFPFFGQLQKLKPKVSKNGRQTPNKSPAVAIRSTTSVPQSGTAILGDDTELSLALHRDHQHSGVTHRAAIKQIWSLCQLQNRASPKPAEEKPEQKQQGKSHSAKFKGEGGNGILLRNAGFNKITKFVKLVKCISLNSS